MKNLIDPNILASFKQDPVPAKEIVEFLDSHPETKTSHLCKLIGIPPRVIYDYRSYWNKKSGSEKCNTDAVVPKANSKKHNRYSAKEKFKLANKYVFSTDKEKAELLRTYGLYQSDIKRWWEQIEVSSLEALGTRKSRSDKKSNEELEMEQLRKDLSEQEKTTAKLSTLLILQKKTFDMLKKKD